MKAPDVLGGISRESQQQPSSALRILDCRTAAQQVGVSYHTMRAWVLAGYIPRIELPSAATKGVTLRRLLIFECDLMDFLKKCRQTPPNPETHVQSFAKK